MARSVSSNAARSSAVDHVVSTITCEGPVSARGDVDAQVFEAGGGSQIGVRALDGVDDAALGDRGLQLPLRDGEGDDLGTAGGLACVLFVFARLLAHASVFVAPASHGEERDRGGGAEERPR